MDKEVFPIRKHNIAKILQSGFEYETFYLNLIKKSKEIIVLQTYIFSSDEFAKKVCKELVDAVRRGVQVYILIDDLGSRLFYREYEIELEREGVVIERFNEIAFFNLPKWGRRLHHKVLIVDHKEAIVGGINLTTSYDEGYKTPRLDFALHLQGEVLEDITYYCKKIFKRSIRNKISNKPSDEYLNQKDNDTSVRVSINDWMYHRWQIAKQYRDLIQNAKSELVIINSYFFPRKKLLKELLSATKRGVKVALILPKFSDWTSHVLASQYFYEVLLQGGVEIYQWKKSMHHGKVAIVDQETSIIGSFNLHYTSFQGNLEMNIEVYSKEFSQELTSTVSELMKNGCEKVEYTDFLKASTPFVRFKRFFCYVAISMIANFSIGLTQRKESGVSEKEMAPYLWRRSIISVLFFPIVVVGLMILFLLNFLLSYVRTLMNKRVR